MKLTPVMSTNPTSFSDIDDCWDLPAVVAPVELNADDLVRQAKFYEEEIDVVDFPPEPAPTISDWERIRGRMNRQGQQAEEIDVVIEPCPPTLRTGCEYPASVIAESPHPEDLIPTLIEVPIPCRR